MNYKIDKIKAFLEKNYKLIKIIITLFLIYVIFSKVNLVESIKLFSRINFLILIPLILYVPALWISTLKWKIALEEKNNFWNLFKIYWVSNFFSNFLPSTIGGDSYKVLKLRKRFGTKKVLESVIFDRLSGFLGMIILASLFSFFTYEITKNIYLFLMPFIVLIGFLFFYFLNFSLSNFKKIKLFFYLKKISKDFNKKLLILLPLSLILLLFGSLSLWIYYSMFGYSINFFIILSFYSIIQLISMIPISINSLGIREGGMIYFFMILGIPAEISLSIAILSRLILIFQTSVGGVIYLKEKLDFTNK